MSDDRYKCPCCGGTDVEVYDLGDDLTHIECVCGVGFTPDMSLRQDQEPRSIVELDI